MPQTDTSPVYPYPCCGYLMFSEPPGSDSICEICFWQDDFVKLRFPTMRGGPCAPSLVEAQAEVAEVGASERRFIGNVRKPDEGDRRDPEWRPFDMRTDRAEPLPDGGWLEGMFDQEDYPEDLSRLYYWRADYWLRKPN
jgi:hypothetical protein